MRKYTNTPDLSNLTVIKGFKEQKEKFWYKGHPEFDIPDFNDQCPEDIWTGFLSYLDKISPDGEVCDQNGGNCDNIQVVDPTTGLTKCRYVAEGIQLSEDADPKDINVYVEGYVVSGEGGATHFAATKVEVDFDGAIPSAEGSDKRTTFCFTGVRLKELQDAFNDRGWIEKTCVAKGLDYLVAKDPDSTSGKAQKARDLGIKVISLDEFKEMLGPVPVVVSGPVKGIYRELSPMEVEAYSSKNEHDIENDRILKDEGFIMVKTTIGDLAVLEVGTSCGTVGNTCFVPLAKKHGGRQVICWFHPTKKEVNGMPLIACNEKEAENIEEIASNKGDGSLRANGKAKLAGFYEFEVE